MNEENLQNNLSALYTMIERTFGKKIVENEDYARLSESIMEQTHELISESTLKRMFGYVASTHMPRRSTLDVMSRYVGYQGWHAFLRSNEDGSTESNPMLANVLKAKDLVNGQRVVVRWLPDRMCVLRYVGQERFVVEEVRGSKLSVGDEFRCALFIQGAPLYLSDATLKGMRNQQYVCGRVHGVQFNLMKD